MLRIAAFTATALMATAVFAQTPAPKEEDPAPRQPRAALPGPNAVPGIPADSNPKPLDFSTEEHMPKLSGDQVAVIGAKVTNESGDAVGTVENVVLDHQGSALALIVGVNKLFGLTQDHVEVPWDKVRFERKDSVVSFVTPLNREELRDLAKFTPPKREAD